MKLTSLSLVIPAYNEAKRLPDYLPGLADYMNKRFDDYEVIVVDDGSQDRTVDITRSYSDRFKSLIILKNPGNKGKGFSVRTGVQASKFEYVLMSDADFSTPVDDLERLETMAGPDKLIIGSRAVKGSDITRHQPFYREYMGKIFNLIVRGLVVSGIHDTQCGFKLIGPLVKERVIPRMKVDGFAFDVEMILLSRIAGLDVREVGVRWRNDERSRVNPVTDSLKMIAEVVRIRRMHKNTKIQEM